MPRARLHGKRRTGDLSQREEMDLLLGNRGAFADEADRRQAWRQHREELMASINIGSRPQAFWDYDAPAKIPFESDLQALDRLNLLTAEEFAYWAAAGMLPTKPATGRDPRELLRATP